MIAYEDFIPRVTKPGGLFRRAEYDSFAAAVAGANAWIEKYGVRVLHVETVVLPNVWQPGEEGTEDPALVVGTVHTWHQFVRVWYEPTA